MKQNYDLTVNYVYFPLHPQTPAEGLRLDELFGRNVDFSAMTQRLNMILEAEGLPYGDTRSMTYNSRLAQELAKWGESKPETEQLNTALYQAYFVDGLNIGAIEVLLAVVKEVGLSQAEAREVLEKRTMQDAVDADWQYARSIGVTAVPTFTVGLTGVVGAQPYEQLARLVEYAGASKR